MKNIMQKALNWILISSANPAEVSLTVKGLLVGAVPVLMALIGFTQINVGASDVNNIINAVTTFVQSSLTLVAALMTIIGIIRKLLLDIKTKPQV